MPEQHPVPVNLVVLRGALSRPPESRLLPSGDEVVNYEVTVARPDGPAEGVPVVWSDPPARRPNLDTGDEIVVVGRVRRRFFRAGGATQSRTEVVAERVVAGRPARRAEAAVARALIEALATLEPSSEVGAAASAG